jgi:hypothetical protein
VATIAPTAPTIATFPAKAVESCLRDELIEVVKSDALIKGIPLPTTPAEIVKVSVHIDSLVAVSILCAVEPILGFELPYSVVLTGGYASVEKALRNLLPSIQKQWEKRYGAKP